MPRSAEFAPGQFGIGRLFHSIRDAVIVADPTGRIMLWNPAAAAMFGYTPEEAAALPLEALVPPRLRERHLEGMRRFHATGTGRFLDTAHLLELPGLRKDGSEVLIQMSLSVIDGGPPPGRFAVAIIRDVTEQRRAEALTQHYAEILASTGDAVIGKTIEGTITSWNHGAEELYGYTAAEAVGRPASLIVPPDRLPEERQVLTRVADGGTVSDLQTERITKDGRRIVIAMTASPIRDATGAVVGESEIERNITDRRHAEAQRQLALERLARIAELEEDRQASQHLLRTASHELKTPLTVLGLQLQLLRASLAPPTEEQARNLEVLERNVRRLGRLVRDVLDVARLQGGHLALRRSPVDLASLAAEVVDAMAAHAGAKGVALHVVAAGPAPTTADPERIQQVLYNLLGNAVKFTPAGGRVEVRVQHGPEGVMVEVADTGRGLTAEEAGRLFQPFSQVHEDPAGEGTGLGLYISRGIVEQHGGAIGVRSDGPGRGATFWFRLPAGADLSPGGALPGHAGGRS